MGEKWTVLKPGQSIYLVAGRPVILTNGAYGLISEIEPSEFDDSFMIHTWVNPGQPDQRFAMGNTQYPGAIAAIAPRWSEEQFIEAIRQGYEKQFLSEMPSSIVELYRKEFNKPGRLIEGRR